MVDSFVIENDLESFLLATAADLTLHYVSFVAVVAEVYTAVVIACERASVDVVIETLKMMDLVLNCVDLVVVVVVASVVAFVVVVA